MTNHPGRKPGSAHPDPALIKATRGGVLQTQTEAAETVHASLRTWQDWEAGKRRMPLAAWELYITVHCLPGGMLRAAQWHEWLRPEIVRALV